MYTYKKKFTRFFAYLFDFVGSLIFFPFLLFKKKKPGNIANILIIRLDHIGDVISATPIVQNLNSHYKGAKITFLVSNSTKEIALNSPYVDEVICYDAPWFSRKTKTRFSIINFFKLAGQLRKHDYDLGFELRGDLRQIILMVLSGVKFRISYGITGGRFLLHKKIEYKKGLHAIEQNLDMLRSLNVEIKTDKPKVFINGEDKQSMQTFFKKNSISEEDFVVTMHPHPAQPSNRWTENRFAELIDLLFKGYNAKVILAGADQDKQYNEEIMKKTDTPIINAAGLTNFGSFAAMLEKSSLFIGVHSGPMHLADTMGIPMVTLYGGSNRLGDWAPRGSKSVVIQKEIPCKGCGIFDCKDNICMDLVSVEDVMEAVKEVAGR